LIQVNAELDVVEFIMKVNQTLIFWQPSDNAASIK